MHVAEVFQTLDYGPAPESATLVQAWLDSHDHEFDHYIGGQWAAPVEGELFETVDPAHARPLARVAQGSAADIDAAVAAARQAHAHWSRLPGHARARYLYAIARHLQKHTRFFAVLESLDNGKPIRESRDIDVPLVARHFYHHAGWAQLLEEQFPGYASIGVAGQIIPWNFPLLMLAWKVAPALAAGNTVVLKPAEFTPLTALRFAELCHEVNLPPGVVNIVTGDGRTGAALVQHPDVDKIAFTGSTEVGRIIREATAGTGKRLSLELGGKSPFIVYDDADLDSVVEGVVDAIWFNQGQVCCAGSRILAQEGIAPQLVAKLKARMETLRIGDPLDKAIDIGAIIAPVQLDKIQRLVQQGEEEGALVWQPSWSIPSEGYFYPPTLCTEVAPAATIAQVEIFGPVVVLMTFRTPAESVELANNTRYGLAASIWTENINLALDIAPRVKAGTVWINCTNVFDAASGFGGYRESGFGREGGREGLWEYLRAVDPIDSGTPAVDAGSATVGDTSPSAITTAATGTASNQTPDAAPPATAPTTTAARPTPSAHGAVLPSLDRTAKLYVGGRQVRPDQGYSLPVSDGQGRVVGEVGRGNRKDIREAVEAAHRAEGWARSTAHLRAQILYYIAENLEARREDFAARITQLTGADPATGRREVAVAITRLFTYGAWADKWEGAVHHTPFRNVTLAMPEPIGVMGIVCPDELPLLALLAAVAPPIATGNTVVVIPSQRIPLLATDLYQVLDTSDLPPGVVNIVTGLRDELVEHIAAHDDVDAVWYFAADDGSGKVERLSVGNMKRTWVDHGRRRDWWSPRWGAGEEFLRHCTQVKNIWIPYGE